MRIVSLRVTSVAKILAVVYGALGLTLVPTLALTGAKQMTLPLGILAPMVYLNLNFHLPMPSTFLTGVLSDLAASLCYAVTGWMTGAAAVLAFNFVAARMGGIEVSRWVAESQEREASAGVARP